MNEPRLASDQSPEPQAPVPEISIATEKTYWLDRASDYLSDRLGSILVKEARQAIKSRQFLYTFFLLLAAVAVWTMIGFAFATTSRYNEGPGVILLTGYWSILGFPLAIVIPFGAFRSLAREFDDGTIQLISISTMRSWHIVTGKMASTCLQMLVYISVLAPCIVFTYLLRGVSLSQILVGLSICIAGSICLSSIGLFLAGAARSKVFSVGISVLFILGLGFVFIGWCNLASSIAYNYGDFANMILNQGQFLYFGMMSLAITTTLIMLATSSAQISFAADNQATLPRIMLLVQQVFFLAFCFCLYAHTRVYLIPVTVAFFYCHYWMIIGFIMSGESPQLSARVRRSLPKSVAARSLFSLFLPGPGRGLVFALSNIWICSLTILVFSIFSDTLLPTPSAAATRYFGGSGPPAIMAMTGMQIEKAIWGVIATSLYASFFLSTSFLITRALAARNPSESNPMVGFLVGLILVAGTTTLSIALQFNLLTRYQRNTYSSLSLPNGYWTCTEISDNLWGSVDPFLFSLACLFMAIPIVIACHWASKEFLATPEAIPERLKIEDEQIRLARRPDANEETIDEIFNAPRENDPVVD